MHKRLLALATSTAVAVALSACGGGGGGGGGGSSEPDSYWSMGDYEYVNGGTSSSTTSTVGGSRVTTFAFTTATTSGGDSSNGTFSGSALSISIKNGRAGAYTLYPTRSDFLAAAADSKPAFVTVTVGTSGGQGAVEYTAQSGQIVLTLDASDEAHFDTGIAIPTSKTLEVAGGITGAPSSLSLEAIDVH